MNEVNREVVDVRELALKCSSKEEVYKVLTITGKVYLPPVQQVNCDFISDLLCGEKKFVNCDRVKLAAVPHIIGLRIPEILNFAREHCEVDKYMPDYESDKYPSRKWICNVVNSLIPEKFSKFVSEMIIQSNDKIDEKKGNKFPVIPEMAKMFKETKLVSKRQSRFYQLIKSSKKKRQERNDNMNIDNKDKKLEELIEKQDEEIEDLKQMLTDTKARLEEHERDSELLRGLYEKGYIDLDGNPIEKDNDQ